MPSLRHYGMSFPRWKKLNPEDGAKADIEAMRKDWEAVGSCLQWAMDEEGERLKVDLRTRLVSVMRRRWKIES